MGGERASSDDAANGRVGVTKTWKLYVGGAFVRSESGHALRQDDAAGVFLANLARASRKDLRDAVGAARKAQGPWAARSAFNRGQILFRVAEMLEGRRAAFEDLLVRTRGVSRDDAARELEAAVDRLFWYAGWTDKFAQVTGSVNPVAAPYFDFSLPDPMGVVVLLAPRESSLLGLVSAFAPAIATGNTCVVVADGPAPIVALELGEVLATSDVPAGVVNLLSGPRTELGSHAAAHMNVNALAIHGGSAEERRDLELVAAENLKRVTFLEDVSADDWRSPERQSPYRMAAFVEWKTTWHPIGV